jgi:23S rRNA pseudoU1915 N3-methylase RlmH
MSKSFMKNFLPAMEDLQLGEPESSSDFSEASVENAALALQESTAEGEALVSSTDEATQVATTLDAIQGHMVEANATDNGISPPVANVLNAAVEHFCTRLGAPSRRIIPAMECFGGTQSRQKATSLAIEGLKEMASKIWAAIVAAFKRMMDWLVGFFQNFQLSSKHLLARAEKLDTEAKKNTGDKKAEDAMIEQSKAESFIKHLLVDGKPAKAAEFTTLFTKLMDESKAELKTLYAGASSFSSASGEIMTTLHTGK